VEKIRNGKGGELTAEIFETWFPYMTYKDPELFLMDFLRSGSPMITMIINNSDDTFIVTNITPEFADALLDEFKEMKNEGHHNK
jgi:hypothetical protein